MIDLDGRIVWSATDLTHAATCEYAFLRDVDRLLGWAPPADHVEEPLLARAGEMGARHEQAVLADYVAAYGEHDPHHSTGVARLEQAGSRSPDTLAAMAAATRSTLEQGVDVVYQAGFFDGEFHGYADFLRRTEQGWVVADTKIARRAKVAALLQVAAYADQLQQMGVPLAPHAELILGTGATQEFPLADIVPVFRERRERVRRLLDDHLPGGVPASWGDDAYAACGASSCQDCQEAIEETRDLALVAGLRMDQRRKLRDCGVHTVEDLADVAADRRPAGMGAGTFARLRAQATMQRQPSDGDEQVRHEVIDTTPLLRLPNPSPGDLFFDFEGDPLYHESGSERWGLEYLWGVLRDPDTADGAEPFEPLWADDRDQERAALEAFMARVTELRQQYPDLHIYHYAPYEITALKRLTAEHKRHEETLDDLLRHGVFVDLYAVVRAAVRVSRPSYSLKELEPLYMGERRREGDVQAGDVSVVEYHRYRELEAGSAEAQEVKESLLDYNRYDCESTLELSRWLRDLVKDHPARAPEAGEEPPEQQVPEPDPELDRLRASLLARSGPDERAARTDEEQAWAMLESALGYHRREDKPFWWADFDRLLHPMTEWADTRDVLVVESVEVVQDWHREGRQRLERRRLALTGQLGEGSTIEVGDKVYLLCDVPLPQGMKVPVHGLRGHGQPRQVKEIDDLEDGRVRLTVEEAVTTGQATFEALPVATTPHGVVHTGPLQEAIQELATAADQRGALPAHPGLDLLLRRPPRTTSGSLSEVTDPQEALVASLQELDRSYLAVQGPPGTGKTRTGSRVVAELVRDHGWRVGVVAQSHAVVEHMLDAICGAELDPARVGKRDKRSAGSWTGLNENKDLLAFCEERSDGYVIGGTAWTFTGSGVPAGSLDLLVADEAGQFSLASTLAVSRAAERLLLLGDPQQLPQVSQGTHGEPVDASALRWLMGDHETLPAGLGHFLDTTYRMHPEVCRPVSQLSYAGRLQASPVASQRSLARVEPGVQVVRLTHRGNSTSSVEEADEVVRQVGRMLGAAWTDEHGDERPLAESNILVVTPYNAQRQLILSRLAEAGHRRVEVGTVDKFQGRQAPVVLMSMTASNRDEVPRGMGFVLNRNRVNVAVSRAQWLAVIVRSRELTAYVPTTPEDLLELGAFVGLCEASST